MIEDHIQNLQDDVWAVLSADPGFEFVPVFRSRTPLAKDENGQPIPGTSTMIDDDIDAALSGIQLKGGKCGIAVIVMLPDVKPVSEDSIGPSLEMMLIVRIVENRLFNEGATGTGITASRLALHTVQVLNRRSVRGSTILRPDPQKMIDEIPLPDDQKVHEVKMLCTQAADRISKVRPPQVAKNAGEITLSTATAGAAIYYTLDGSWPLPSTATLYDGPFTLEPGSHALRVVATAADHTPSDDVWADVQVSA